MERVRAPVRALARSGDQRGTGGLFELSGLLLLLLDSGLRRCLLASMAAVAPSAASGRLLVCTWREEGKASMPALCESRAGRRRSRCGGTSVLGRTGSDGRRGRTPLTPLPGYASHSGTQWIPGLQGRSDTGQRRETSGTQRRRSPRAEEALSSRPYLGSPGRRRHKGDKEKASGSKQKASKKCPVCSKKLSSDHKKTLCQGCTEKVMRAEQPSLIEELRGMVRQEVQALSQRSPKPNTPPPKKRKVMEETEEQEDLSEGLIEDEDSNQAEEAPVTRRYDFSSEYLEELIIAVRKTMEVEQEKPVRSVQEEMFGGLRSKKNTVFHIHKNITEMVLEEWETPEKKLFIPQEIKSRFPVDEETAKYWGTIPKVDIQLAKVAKKTTVAFEDSSQLKDPMDRKTEGLLRCSWEASAALLSMNSVSTCVARSMSRWMKQLGEHIAAGTPREDLLESLPLLQRANDFLADASIESVRAAAKVAALSNSVRRSLWLRSWSGDTASKMKLCSIPFRGEYMFGPDLDKVLEKSIDRKKSLPESKEVKKKPFRPFSERTFRPFPDHTQQYRGKGKGGRWGYQKGGRGRNLFFSQGQRQQKP